VKLPADISRALPLGSGGEGDVFRAWQNPPGRTVLLKYSRDAEGARRLRREAKLLSSLAGGPVPSLLSFRDDSRHALLVLEWLEGVALGNVPVAELSLAQRQGLFLATCRAVARLHEAGLVHGDLSRANLMAQLSSGVEVVDLGVAFRPDEESTPPGLGAWEAVAPEALRGDGVSAASDVFALGCQALFLFDAVPESLRTSRSLWNEAAFSGELAHFAEPIHPAVVAALAPDPKNRPANASLLLDVLLEDASWRRPGWPGELLAKACAGHEDHLLENEAKRCAQVRDWNGAWCWQKERVEASETPETLLPLLSEYARRKASVATIRRWRVVAGVALACCAMAVGIFAWHREVAFEQGIRTGTLHTFDESVDSLLYPSSGSEARGDALLPLQLGPQPPNARLWVDGQPEDLPGDGVLWMEPGAYHIELRDASGNLLRDSLVHLRGRRRRKLHPETHRPQPLDTTRKSFPATSHEERANVPQTLG